MANTTLTHKVRNPKDLSLWIEDWTATIHDDKTYEIQPSANWTIPVNQIASTTQQGESSKIVGALNGTLNHLAQFSDDHTITNGPQIDATNGSTTKFLNEKGSWTTLSGGSEFDITSNGTISHSNSITGSDTDVTVDSTAETGHTNKNHVIIQYPAITYNNQGHITAVNNSNREIKITATNATRPGLTSVNMTTTDANMWTIEEDDGNYTWYIPNTSYISGIDTSSTTINSVVTEVEITPITQQINVQGNSQNSNTLHIPSLQYLTSANLSSTSEPILIDVNVDCIR